MQSEKNEGNGRKGFVALLILVFWETRQSETTVSHSSPIRIIGTLVSRCRSFTCTHMENEIFKSSVNLVSLVCAAYLSFFFHFHLFSHFEDVPTLFAASGYVTMATDASKEQVATPPRLELLGCSDGVRLAGGYRFYGWRTSGTEVHLENGGLSHSMLCNNIITTTV